VKQFRLSSAVGKMPLSSNCRDTVMQDESSEESYLSVREREREGGGESEEPHKFKCGNLKCLTSVPSWKAE
jgi:hypothetical protein